MLHRDSSWGITGEDFKETGSGNIGRVPRAENLPTNRLQAFGNNHDTDASTKAYKGTEDWLPKTHQEAESGMHKNTTEDGSVIEHEDAAIKSQKRTTKAASSWHASNRRPPAGMLIPPCLGLPNRTIEMLRSAMRNPPVTVSTLGELNLTWMMHYVNLRCDINFDHDLHFTPIKGPRGEEKRSQAVDYWLALEAEFRIYQHDSRACMVCKNLPGSLDVFEPRLSNMFQDLKDLLETLVPDRDHGQVDTNLDVDLIMQQVENGLLDIGKLSRWLATLLMSHCAPMRDESAEEMADKLELGANTGDRLTLMSGLESLFGFLEAMKLDVANHQIRTFRYILIEETVAFQQSHFKKRIDDGRLNLEAAEVWYQDVCERQISPNGGHLEDGYFEAFLHGFVELCTSSPHKQKIPITLHYDQGRIQQLRADVQDLVVLQLCVQVFNELLSGLKCSHHVPLRAYATLQNRLLTIADDESAEPGFVLWNEKIVEVAIEITRAAFVVASSPNPPPQIPADAFDQTEARLQQVYNTDYGKIEEQLLSQLAGDTVQFAAVFQQMSTMEMSEAQKQYQQNRQARGDLALPDLENMARSLAHMGVLHWQVWRDLAYVRDGDELHFGSDETPLEQDSTTASGREGRGTQEFRAKEASPKATIENRPGQAWDNT